MDIELERPEHISDIWQVNARAFGREAEANLVDALRTRGAVVASVVAVTDRKVVGHAMFTCVKIEPSCEHQQAVGLGPVAELPEYQRKGIGTAITEAGLQYCQKQGFDLAVVLGHPSYYPRFGFKKAAQFGISCQFEVPEDAFMVVELQPGAFVNCRGTVYYEPEFASV